MLCDCFETGAATPPPCPVVFDETWIHPASGFEGRKDEVREWTKTACAHPWFRLVDHQVRRMAMLKAMAGFGDAAAFPVVHAAMPRRNGGSVTPADSARCLAELDRLQMLMGQDSTAVIVNSDTGEIVFALRDDDGLAGVPRTFEPIPAMFGFDEGGAVRGINRIQGRPLTSTWLGADAVVRVLDTDGSLLLVAKAFAQEPDGGDWLLRDESTGATVHHCSPVGQRGSEPHRMHAEIRPIDIDFYLPGVAELRELFEASVATGRPVYWC